MLTSEIRFIREINKWKGIRVSVKSVRDKLLAILKTFFYELQTISRAITSLHARILSLTDFTETRISFHLFISRKRRISLVSMNAHKVTFTTKY